MESAKSQYLKISKRNVPLIHQFLLMALGQGQFLSELKRTITLKAFDGFCGVFNIFAEGVGFSPIKNNVMI